MNCEPDTALSRDSSCTPRGLSHTHRVRSKHFKRKGRKTPAGSPRRSPPRCFPPRHTETPRARRSLDFLSTIVGFRPAVARRDSLPVTTRSSVSEKPDGRQPAPSRGIHFLPRPLGNLPVNKQRTGNVAPPADIDYYQSTFQGGEPWASDAISRFFIARFQSQLDCGRGHASWTACERRSGGSAYLGCSACSCCFLPWHSFPRVQLHKEPKRHRLRPGSPPPPVHSPQAHRPPVRPPRTPSLW